MLQWINETDETVFQDDKETEALKDILIFMTAPNMGFLKAYYMMQSQNIRDVQSKKSYRITRNIIQFIKASKVFWTKTPQ